MGVDEFIISPSGGCILLSLLQRLLVFSLQVFAGMADGEKVLARQPSRAAITRKHLRRDQTQERRKSRAAVTDATKERLV